LKQDLFLFIFLKLFLQWINFNIYFTSLFLNIEYIINQLFIFFFFYLDNHIFHSFFSFPFYLFLRTKMCYKYAFPIWYSSQTFPKDRLRMGYSIFLLRLIVSSFLVFTFLLEAVYGSKKASKLLLLIAHSSDTKIVAQNYDDDDDLVMILLSFHHWSLVIFHKCLILFAVLHRILGNTLSCFQPYFCWPTNCYLFSLQFTSFNPRKVLNWCLLCNFVFINFCPIIHSIFKDPIIYCYNWSLILCLFSSYSFWLISFLSVGCLSIHRV